MAKKIEGGVEVEEMVDLSPEAMEVKRNLERASTQMIDKGRVQAIVERWRQRKQFISNVQDNEGNLIPIPNIVVTDRFVADLERQLAPIIEDCCDDSEAIIVQKVKRQRPLNTDGGSGVKALDTALSSLRGNLTVPPTPSR